ncbi:MAG: hypothetical protein ACYSX0_18955 [Planctomycetota bacterium]|jgi:hypothetical protein
MRVALWIVAVTLMLGAAAYQRFTGPTYPMRGAFEVSGEEHRYRLIRSDTKDARVAIPDPGGVQATLFYKRYNTKDDFTALSMNREQLELAAYLPVQPPAGKLEYYIGLSGQRIPAGENVIIRFKGEVPAWVLIPHVVFMFFSIVFGLRTGLAALFRLAETRTLALVTLGGLTLGGMILGPIVQQFAFGELWTGWPNGYDLTDNKTLIMWLVWLVACGVLGLRPRKRTAPGRVAVVAATLVMMVVYLIPHSMRGSELDYNQLDKGVDPTKAIRTG